MSVEISIQNLTKIYEGNIVALRDLNLEIGTGVFGLLGPNGSGKTTLMRIIATLLEATRGEVRVQGFDVRKDRVPIRRLLGYLPQEFGLYPSLTAYENLDYMALLYNISHPAQRKAAVERALERTHLSHWRDRRVGTFSGGMKQRLGIAQALLNEPKLLIVDEPTAGLDPEERIRIRSLLAELGGDRVIILSTHIVADIEAVADTLGVLLNGQLLFHGLPGELLQKIAGRVWLLHVQREQLAQIKEKYVETGVFRSAAGMQVRVIADQVDEPGAQRVEPTLEDAYIWLMGGQDRA